MAEAETKIAIRTAVGQLNPALPDHTEICLSLPGCGSFYTLSLGGLRALAAEAGPERTPDLFAFAKAYDAFMASCWHDGVDCHEATLPDADRALWRQCRAAIQRAEG